MAPHGKEIEPWIRDAILGYWWKTSPRPTWFEVGEKFNVNPFSARKMVMTGIEKSRVRISEEQKVLPDAVEVTFEQVAAAIGCDTERAGRPAIFPPGSQQSQELFNRLFQDSAHWNQDVEIQEIAENEMGIRAARSTLEGTVKNQFDTYRYVGREKPRLNKSAEEKRVQLAEMGLELPEDAIVYMDEMWVEFNTTRRKRKQWRPKGANPYRYARKKKKDQGAIRMMIAACIAKGFKSRLYIYDPRRLNDVAHQKDVARQMNVKLKAEALRKADAARIEGTSEHEVLTVFNQNIERRNQQEGRVGRHKRRKRKAEQFFTAEKVPEDPKGGISWVPYWEEFCESVLYPFCSEVQRATGHPIIYLAEDNAPAHKVVKRIDSERRKELGIITLPWPPNSPDLNRIERCWDPLKDAISNFNFNGAGSEEVARAKRVLETAWTDLPQHRVDKEVSDFHHKCRQVLAHNGKNDFEG